jgi:hypothetical protein
VVVAPADIDEDHAGTAHTLRLLTCSEDSTSFAAAVFNKA